MVKTAVCLRVSKKYGESAIALAGKMGLIDRSLSISRKSEYLLIPLLRDPTDAEKETLKKETAHRATPKGLEPITIEREEFKEKVQPFKTLTQALQDQLPTDLLAVLPQAFDIVGDIVIIDIPPLLKAYQTLIGKTILETHRNINTVLAKAGDISGVYRIRDYDLIAGEAKTSTVHREFGCVYRVDVARAYFSPRLSHEHERVASQVQAGEVVVDLFAGVGPFAVLIGKQQPEGRVYAVDLNPDAVELLKINVKINKVVDRVFPICADAKEIAVGELKGIADRVIMNLPETAIDFVDTACRAIKPEGGVMHFYGFVRSPDSVNNLMQRFTEAIKHSGRTVKTFLYTRSIRETAPFESQVVLDIQIQ
ncbi:class I SAM-dependent methyltransferase family protein [Candidatus Bathycorpusculum sp.]|uniref:class I SAM-dependent methyltransferase n=1 Tax=Candidatus Bathycorpusculum sp. TaxID=2994959 RepID=UPI00282321C5|nr:class I SAM-dependent methyltransferase family protein [Candidatus Termitimicrobium sp.]MCL2432122.1 class I SAM-dependent methyltransferase family protein [Candidatus Termitimicrobium sp.]